VNATARAAAGLPALLLAACASLFPPAQRLPGDLISGRLSVRVEATVDTAARSLNAAFELEGDAKVGKLSLATPLGTTLARVSWSPSGALLVTPQEQTPYADLDSLTEKLLGESVPVSALFDWLRGRPWPDAPSRASATPATPGFCQLGWDVDLADFGDALVRARRERAPGVTVRAKLDRP
jgi:outer membrane lipoprotein LolB